MLSKVLIIGAGTGGLCLAPGLKQAGIDVSVFERDRTPTDRLQGYRLHISSSGAHAMELALLKVHQGQSDLIPALHAYELEMIDRGFRAVEASLKQMKQVHSEGRFANAMRSLWLRTIDRLPVHLKKAIMQHQ